jgi:hypothetical protein
MADPVEQIFLQSQAGSADGAGFGEFFQRGQQIEQQSQKLDIDREQTRIANATLGLRVKEGEAKQLKRVAELEQDTLFAQNYATWISQKAKAKHIPQLMGLVNGTSKSNPIVEEFFERVKGIRDIEDDANLRAALLQEKADNFPSAEDQDAQLKFIRDNGMVASWDAATGFFRGKTPSGESFEVIREPDGRMTWRRLLGSGVGEPTEGETPASVVGQFQTGILQQQELRSQIGVLRKLAIPENVGVSGKVKAGLINNFLAPLQELVGLKPTLATGVQDFNVNLALLRVKLMSALKPDAQMSKQELEELQASFPSNEMNDTAAGINRNLDSLEAIVNAREYLLRRSTPDIELKPLFDRLSRQKAIDLVVALHGKTIGGAGIMTFDEAAEALTLAGIEVVPDELPNLPLPETLPDLPNLPGSPNASVGVEGN